MGKPLVGAYMATRFVTLTPGMTLFEAVEVFLKHGILGAPVVDEDERLVGFFSEVDALRLLAVGSHHDVPVGTVRDYMVRKVMTVGPEMDVYWAAGIVLAQGLSYLPVVQSGALIGIINRRALLKALMENFSQ